MVGRWPKLAGRFLVAKDWRQGRQAGSVIVDGLYNTITMWSVVGVTLPTTKVYTRRQGAGLK